MSSIKKFKKVSLLIFTFIFSVAFLAGCGYKPTSSYAKQKIQGNVYVDVIIDLEDPKNSVLVKDALNEIVVSKFGRRLVDKKDLADTLMTIELGSVSNTELQKDEDGYVNLYRTNVSINVKYDGPNGEGNVNVSGSYDFSLADGSTISDVKRFEAIKTASNKALEEFISKIAIQTFKKDDDEKK